MTQPPKILLDGGGAKAFEAAFHYKAYVIKARDFVDCINQLGGMMLKKEKGHGSLRHYILPYQNPHSEPFGLFSIHMPHNGSDDMRPGDLTTFFAHALELSELTPKTVQIKK